MNMAKMTKAQRRKRLTEAAEKIWKVLGSVSSGMEPFTKRDISDMNDARIKLIRMAGKLK